MKKFLLSLCVLLMLTGSMMVYSAAPDIEASSAIMASLTSEQIMYSKNPEQKLAPAELAKLMTVYTTYKQYGLDTKITVPSNITSYSLENNMSLKAGEVMTSGDLIRGMVFAQAHDAAITVALHYGGVEEFVAKMNENAKNLGMKDTVFKNPTGRDAEGQVTTAADLLKLYKEIYKEKKLYEILTIKNVQIPATNLSDQREYWTKNHLMSRFIYLNYVYPYATAGVSSSTSYGGYSVISTAVKGEREYVAVVLNSKYKDDVNHAMTDAQALFNHGFGDFSTVEISKKGTLLYEAELKNHKGKDTLLLHAGKTLKAQIYDEDTVESIEKEIIIDEPVKAPVKKEQVVGKIVYTYQGNLVGELELLAERDVKRSIMKTLFGGVVTFFKFPVVKGILVVILILIACAYIMSLMKNKTQRRRRRNRRKSYRKF